MNKDVYILGDHHGDWLALFNKMKRVDLRDCVLISVGDCGIGFGNKKDEIERFKYLNRVFLSKNVDFYAIRGNHDDPAYFDGNVNFSNFKLLKDGTVLNFNGEKFLFVGGAISIDRKDRVLGKSYWENEGFEVPMEKVEGVSVLITHTGGSDVVLGSNDLVKHYIQNDTNLINDLATEKMKMDFFLQKLQKWGNQLTHHYLGHFHFYQNTIGKIGAANGSKVIVADILDIILYQKKQ